MADFKIGDIVTLKEKDCVRENIWIKIKGLQGKEYFRGVVIKSESENARVGHSSVWFAQYFDLAEPAGQQAEFDIKEGDRFYIKGVKMFYIIIGSQHKIVPDTDCLYNGCKDCSYRELFKHDKIGSCTADFKSKEELLQYIDENQQDIKLLTKEMIKNLCKKQNPEPEEEQTEFNKTINNWESEQDNMVAAVKYTLRGVQCGVTNTQQKFAVSLLGEEPKPEPFNWFKIYKVYIKRAKTNCEICNGSGVKRIYPLLELTGMPCKCLCDYVRYYYGKEKIKIFKPQGNIIQVKFQGKKWQENFGSNSNALDVYNSIPFKNEVAK